MKHLMTCASENDLHKNCCYEVFWIDIFECMTTTFAMLFGQKLFETSVEGLKSVSVALGKWVH